ncbi:hypothetical protein [Streptomyces filamentosus]|uniref:hypothetical protein n=1 Tax=Streptomyces filamentosus TaxID=67294 RepID=UPI0033DC26DE
MRLTIRAAAGHEIDIELGQNTTAALRAAEATALNLLRALPGEQPESETPFGFSATADTERSTPVLPAVDEDE